MAYATWRRAGVLRVPVKGLPRVRCLLAFSLLEDFSLKQQRKEKNQAPHKAEEEGKSRMGAWGEGESAF